MSFVSSEQEWWRVPVVSIEHLFDDRLGIIQNENGRCEGHKNGLYVVGWLKRGPSGIIGTNIADARETVSSIVDDYRNGIIVSKSGLLGATKQIISKLKKRKITYVDWAGFEKIDLIEKDSNRLRTSSQPREKITDRLEMINVVKHCL